MPLTAANMFPGGPIKSADAIEYFNLLTGAMTDQPVTLANTLAVGGFHGVGSVPFRVNGVAAQTANMQEIRSLGTDVNPIFAIGPDGSLKWGPGGGTATDVTLARNGAAALRVTGALSVSGNVTGALTLSNGPLTVGGFAAASGMIRLPNGSGAYTNGLMFRNGANTADVPLTLDTGNRLILGGTGAGIGAVATQNTAAAGAAALPTNPAGFITLNLNGTVVQVPFYA